jgi:hypothetical protein
MGLLALYAAIALFVVLHHEPWRDEADGWLLARDGGLAAILGWTRYAGTPALWYLLLVPLAKSGLPYVSEALLHVGIAAAAVAVFVRCAPFPRSTKYLFVFSYYMAYEYVVVARSYGLSVLLLFCAAALYRARFARPLAYALPIALLYNTNAHSVGTAGCLTMAYAWELWRLWCTGQEASRRRLAAVGLMALGGVFAFLQLRPPSDGNVVGWFRIFEPGRAFDGLTTAFLPLAISHFLWPLPLFVLAMAVLWLRTRPIPLFVLGGSYAWLLYIFVFKFWSSPRHFALLLINLVFALWIGAASTRRDAPRGAPSQTPQVPLRRDPYRLCLAALNVCLVASVAGAALFWYLDFRYEYSGAKSMAAYMRANHLTGGVVAAHTAARGAALLPYLDGQRFWFPATGDFGSYMHWDDTLRRGDALPLADAVARVEERFPNTPDLLFLADHEMPDAAQHGYELLHATTGTVFSHPDESYFLYRRLPDRLLASQRGSSQPAV